jgi:hypothetical protein
MPAKAIRLNVMGLVWVLYGSYMPVLLSRS